MRNLHHLFVSAFVLAFLCVSAKAQLTSVNEFKDVKATDKYFPALRSLVETWGVIDPYPDLTFRGEQPLTREQFVMVLNNSLDRLNEVIASSVAGTDDDTSFIGDYISSYDANETQITSISQLEDITPTYEGFQKLQSLIERFGINLADKDKKFRPQQAVTEQEFYLWIGKIFSATRKGTPSATKAIMRGEAIIVFSQTLDSISSRVKEKVAAATKAKEQKELEEKAKIVRRLPSRGRARIVKWKFYVRDSGVADMSKASDDLKTAYVDGGVWGKYLIKMGDEGDIVYETINIYDKKKLVLLRVGTAIVTIQESGIKRIK